MPEEWLLLYLIPLGWLMAGIVIWLDHRRSRSTLAVVSQRGEIYRSIVEAHADLVCRYRPDTTLTFVNDAYCRHFGRERRHLLGQSFFVLLPESAHAAVRAHVANLFRSRRVQPTEHEVTRPDGTIGWQRWIDYPIVGEDGEILEVQAVGRDITELRNLRMLLEEQHRELLHLNRVAVVGQLTGPLTHEISQPVASILSNAQAGLRLLADPTADRELLRDIIADIADQAQHMSDVIHSLRSLLQRGQIVPRQVDLNTLIIDITLFLRSVLRSSHIHVRHDLAPDLPPVSGDATQLRQLVLNLMINARDAMERTDPARRTLEIATAHAPGGGVECTIRDTGVGISPKCLQRIFEPYFSTKEHGLGLGLSLCQSIIAAHRGELWATNASPGTTFVFRLRASSSPRHAVDITRSIQSSGE